MDPTSQPNTWQTLASVFAGGFLGYEDAQNGTALAVTQPTPGTAFGVQGVSQLTPGAAVSASASSPLLLLLLIGGAFFLLARK